MINVKARIFTIIILMAINFFVVPVGLNFVYLIAKSGLTVATETVRGTVLQNPFWGISLLFEQHIREPWFWMQIPMGTISFLIILGMFFKKGKLGYKEKSPYEIASAGRGEHGTARWRTHKELKKTLGGLESHKGGFVCGVKEGHNFDAYIDTSDTHCLVIGATRSGKSRRIFIPTIWNMARKDENMVITDPKGELYARCSGYLMGMGYEVVRIDLRNPYCGLRWNPLEPIKQAFQNDDIDNASQIAWDLAHLITHQHPHHGDPIWPQAQESLTAALLLATASPMLPTSYTVVKTGKKFTPSILPANEKAHMASAYKLLSVYGKEDGAELDTFLRNFPDNHPAYAAYGVAGLSSERLRGSIFTGTAAQMRLWAEPAVAWLNSKHETDPGIVGKKKAAVFLIIPDERAARNVLASMYIAQCYQELADIALKNMGSLKRRVNFLLDEFGNIPAIPDFDKKLTVAGGRNIRFMLAIQSLAQIKAIYDKQEETIAGNCATWIYLSTADVETAKVLSTKTGQHTVKTESWSTQTSSTNNSGGGSISEGVTGRALLMPDEVMRWEKGNSLFLQTGHNPARLPLIDFTEWPIHEKFEMTDSAERGDVDLKTIDTWELPSLTPTSQRGGVLKTQQYS